MRIAVNMPRYIMSCQLAVVFAWGGKDGRPTQFNTAIACSVKLT